MAPVHRAPLLAAVLALLVMAIPVRGQQMAVGGAMVQIPAVSELDVVSGEHTSTSAGEVAGTLLIRVRANHRWTLVLATTAGTDSSVEVRIKGSGAGGYELLKPGAEAAVVSGGRGETVMELEYRGTNGSDPGELPLVYTLATE